MPSKVVKSKRGKWKERWLNRPGKLNLKVVKIYEGGKKGVKSACCNVAAAKARELRVSMKTALREVIYHSPHPPSFLSVT